MRRTAVLALVAGLILATAQAPASAGRPDATIVDTARGRGEVAALTPEQIRADLVATNALIRQAVPHARIPYFRAPFGSWGASPTVAAELGMQPLGWRLAITDWEPPGTDVLVQRLRDGITPGAVVLMHDGGGDRQQTVEAVDRIIGEFRAQGWRFTLPRRHG